MAFSRLLLILIAIPLLDLVLLAFLSRFMGFWLTLAILLGTAGLGAWLARLQWRWLLRKSRLAGASREVPPELISDGLMLLIGAGLLITPGFLTDLFGLGLMIPWLRRKIRAWAGDWIRRNMVVVSGGSAFYQEADGTVEGQARETPRPTGKLLE